MDGATWYCLLFFSPATHYHRQRQPSDPIHIRSGVKVKQSTRRLRQPYHPQSKPRTQSTDRPTDSSTTSPVSIIQTPFDQHHTNSPPPPRTTQLNTNLTPAQPTNQPTHPNRNRNRNHVQILRPHAPVRPHQDGLRRLLPVRRSRAAALRRRRNLGNGQDGDGLHGLRLLRQWRRVSRCGDGGWETVCWWCCCCWGSEGCCWGWEEGEEMNEVRWR
jgi:hypothetical protein